MDNTQIDANQEITLKLNNEEAEIVKDLLNNYAYAYRSDQEVDCKRELVRKEKIGKYPYFATAPDPELTNPYVDWTIPEWRSRDENSSNASIQALEQVRKNISDLQKAQTVGTQQSEMITKTLGKLMESQENTNKLMMTMQKTMMGLVKQDSQPTDATQPATPSNGAPVSGTQSTDTPTQPTENK